MATERVETTTGICFGNRGSLRRVYDGDGKRIIYPTPEPEFPVGTDLSVDHGSSQNGVHPDGVKGIL